jgi:ATP-dependent helicase/nuclease subunit A
VALEAIFLTKEKTARSANAKVSNDLKKWLSKTDQGISESSYIACKEAWADAFLANVQRDREAVALQLNTAWFAMSAAMLAHVQASKEAMRVRGDWGESAHGRFEPCGLPPGSARFTLSAYLD